MTFASFFIRGSRREEAPAFFLLLLPANVSRIFRQALKGEKHLAFTDFTQENLLKVISNPETKILICCHNNFDGNQRDLASKAFVPGARSSKAAATQFATEARPLMMALNVPTYISLYGYGYRNVYKLDELVKVNDPRITFEGTVLHPDSDSEFARHRQQEWTVRNAAPFASG